MSKIVLFRKHANGIGTWSIEDVADTLIIRHATVEGGQEVEHTEQVTINQSGRCMAEQITLRMNSRVKRMKDRGYVLTREEALLGKTNQLGLPLPMLAQPLKKAKKKPSKEDVLQLKLNGHRCLATKQDGEVILYSRQGSRIYLPHIAEALDRVLYEGCPVVDGELYHHGTPLQTISSWIKKQQPESLQIEYVMYDLVSDDPFWVRYGELCNLIGTDLDRPIRVLPGRLYKDERNQWDYMAEALAGGFEGLIRRSNDEPYEDGKRSQSLVKIKEFQDCEVTVQSIRPSKEGWAVCDCITDDGKAVAVSAPGNKAEKTRVLKEQEKYLGQRLKIAYSELTEDNVPFHAVALEWYTEL